MDSHLPIALCILSALLVLSDTIRSGFYTDNSLDQQTVMAEKTLQRHQKKAVKQEILTLLGLHHRPKPLSPTKENSAPRYMMDLYRSLQEDEEDEQETRQNNPLFHLNLTLPGMEENIDSADIIMSFVNHARHPDIRHGEGRRFFFDFSEVPAVETVGGAELRMYKASPRWSLRSDTFNLLLYRVVEGVNQVEGSLELETNLTVYAYHQGWLDLNVTRAASLWTQYPPSNHGLYMYIKDEHGDDLDPSDVGLVDFTDAEDKQAFLVAFFKATQKVNSRQRRSTSRRQAKEDVTYNDGPGWGAPAGVCYVTDTGIRFLNQSCQHYGETHKLVIIK